MRTLSVVLFTLFLLMPGCGGKSDASYSTFLQRLDAGATCAELFSLRNATDPKSTDLQSINRDLRNIGCYSSSSVRSTQEPPMSEASPGESGISDQTGAFTVQEYRIYRAVIDTPMNISESQAIKAVSDQNRVSVEEVRKVVDKVQRALFRNKWHGPPETEIRHASDWNGERR